MPSWRTLSSACAAVLLASASLAAQGKDRFVTGVVDFINAAEGESHTELVAAVDAMAAGLTHWDSLVARVEAGLTSEIGGVPPQTAARMRMALGAVYLERGRFEAALAQFDAAAALDPSSPDVHVFRGLVFDNAARPDDAADAYRRAWESDPTSAINAYRFLGAVRAKPGSAQTAAAMDTLRAAVGVASTTDGAVPFSFIDLGVLDDAMSPAPVIPFAAHADAFALVRRGRYDEAVARFREAVAADAAAAATSAGRLSERARLAAADASVAAGDETAARQMLRETIRAYPASGRAWWKLGTLLQAFGDQRGAVEALEAAASGAAAGAAPLLATIGRLRHSQLDLDSAVATYAQRVALQPNDSAAHYDLADVYRARDDLGAARVEATAAALLDPASARAFAMIGQLEAAAGRDEDALRMLRKAVALAPADTEARYALGRALLRVGRDEEARRELEVFQQLQSKAMDEERRRFQENMRKIEDTLKANQPREQGR
jgi:tetratricopeptide (TPR) repeat protein